jgi:predicted NBD/HSP70 family sugar kinase
MPAIGIDIGGTKTRGILWNVRTAVRAHEFATPKNPSAFASELLALCDGLAATEDIGGIGIGAAGIVDKTILLASPNIPYIRNFDFRSLWPRPMPLALDNDARSFGRAEFLTGAGRGFNRVFVLTIGTGIGRAYGRGGKIFRVKKFEYPEEWEKEYQMIRDGGDYGKLAEFLGRRLAGLMLPFKPEAVVIGGGVVERQGFFLQLRSALKAQGLDCTIRRSRLGRNAVAIGAVLLLDRKSHKRGTPLMSKRACAPAP